MKIAIFGGTFNPVHNEHINIVKAAIRSLALDKVIIMPSNVTPAKSGRMLADSVDRLNMCKIAFASVPKAVVSDFEITRSGISYSYITCQRFAEEYPDCERYFIVGGDMLENFDSWKFPEKILQCVTLAVCAREDGAKLKKAKDDFYTRFGVHAVSFDYIGKNVSSTKIRVLAALGEGVSDCVGNGVAEYIKRNSLYLLDGAQQVKKSLSEYRWRHTVGVAVKAAENCTKYNVTERDAVTAALYHDCAKELPRGGEAEQAVPEGVPSPVVHQFTGAYLAERVYGVKDKNILDAIRYHCSGRANMTPLEKLVYLADMVEEGRDYDGVEELREIFKQNKEEAFNRAIERHVRHLEVSGLPVYELTQKAYEYAKEHKNDK